MKKDIRDDFEDDGRVIADMSGVSRTPLLIPRIPGLDRKKKTAETPAELTKSEEKHVIGAAILAGLSIALVFIGAGALLIWLLTLIW